MIKKAGKTKEISFILRESRVLLSIRIMTLLIVSLSFFLLMLLLSTQLGPVVDASLLVALNLLFFIVLVILTVVVAFFVVLKWNAEYYKITSDGIIKQSGIIKKHEDRYACSFVEGMTVDQGILGRLFDYGDISIYDPSQQQKIHLMNIPNPNHMGVRIGETVQKSKEKSIPLMPADHEMT